MNKHLQRITSCVFSLILVILCFSPSFSGETSDQHSDTKSSADLEPSTKQSSLAEIDRQLNNPLTSIWSLTVQENLSLNKGDRVDGTRIGNTLFFQPAFPIPVGKDMMFIARPVFPLVTNTILDPTSEDPANSEKTGFGDIQLMSLIGPDRKDGLVWGLGPTFKFPTATHESLGQDKYQAGPAVMLLSIGKPWVLGMVSQHWWSYAGDSDRPKVSRTDFQYIMRRQIPGAMSIGMGPTVVVDWEADSGNKLTFPIGLGITKTVRWGRMPIKLRFEPQYSIIRPDNFGTAWNFRLQVTPVIPNPFK